MVFNDENKIYRYKSLIKVLLNIILIISLSYLYYKVWTETYNGYLRFSYRLKGNVFMAFIYAMIFIIFENIYGGKKIGEYKLINIIFSQTLALIFTNLLVYIAIIVPAAALGFIEPSAMVITTFIQFIVIVIWALISNTIMISLFPPVNMLLIYGNKYKDTLIAKFNSRNDIYNIKESICIDNDFDLIKEKCLLYNNIIIGDIDSIKRNEIIKFCFSQFKTTYVLPKLSDIILKKSEEFYLFDSPLYIARNEGITLESSFFKRAIDLACSIITLVILSPLLLIVSTIIKITDGGPIIFKQERVTKDGKLFTLYKFRSMKIANDDLVKPTQKDDDRITGIGKIIRRTHFDEVPQLINVLKNDMSIVGPRPERKEHVDLYSKQIVEFPYRHKVKAGLTGLAQIYGKYNTSAYDKLKLDLMYIQNYSLILDLEIMFKTIKILFMKENTEGFDEKEANDITFNTQNE